MELIATFYSHFGAVRFVKKCKNKGLSAKLMPVPRTLSSSCGTCVSYEVGTSYSVSEELKDNVEEVEQIVEVTDDGYVQLYRAKNS